jgi:hypothetical protein
VAEPGPALPRTADGTALALTGLPVTETVSLGDGQASAVSDCRCLDPAAHLQLAQDVRHVNTRRLDADVERLSDLTVGASGGDKGEEFQLPRRLPEVSQQVLCRVTVGQGDPAASSPSSHPRGLLGGTSSLR